jgi:SAM-dependent methyltransferase
VYKLLKKRIKSILPKSFLFKNELFIRYFYGLLYLGNRHQCNICLKHIRAFIQLKDQELMCPFCGSLSRNRRLWKLLIEDNSVQGTILHFSPSRSLYRKLKRNKKINYYSSDFEDEFLANYKFDITNIAQTDKKFDTIICYHVLEHIVDDEKAMTELYRVSKSNGIVYTQTPFKEGDIYEDYSIITPEKRKEHFGQDDHVRIYSIKGLKKRLEKVGFNVVVKTFISSKEDFYFGLMSQETVLILTK